MPVSNLNHHLVPSSLRGALACNSYLIPRFWATVWIDTNRSRYSESSNKAAVVALKSLYETADLVLDMTLDQAIAKAEYEALRICLGAHLQKLNNAARQREVDLSKSWNLCLRFVDDILVQIAAADDGRWDEIKQKLSQLRRTYEQLTPARSKEPAPIRALPAQVVEELYAIFDPASSQNPFRLKRDRLRNFLIFLILLHLGLRRSELLVVQIDAFQSEFDFDNDREVSWLIIDYLPNSTEDDDEVQDPRSSKPSLKNNLARRLLPVSQEISATKDVYLNGNRRKTCWPFLFISQKGRPLSTRQVNQIFEIATDRLSPEAKAALKLRGKDGVQPHDLRHTCAVRRLSGYRAQGHCHNDAVERLRVFFGWDEASPMPARYARAYYETDYDTVWQDNYDSYVEAVRKLGEIR